MALYGLIGVKRKLSFFFFLSRQPFSKQHFIENEHTFKCGNRANIQKNKGSSWHLYFYSQLYLTSMLLNDQEYL